MLRTSKSKNKKINECLKLNAKNNQIVNAGITWLEMRLWNIWGFSNLFIWTPLLSYTHRVVGLQLTGFLVIGLQVFTSNDRSGQKSWLSFRSVVRKCKLIPLKKSIQLPFVSYFKTFKDLVNKNVTREWSDIQCYLFIRK